MINQILRMHKLRHDSREKCEHPHNHYSHRSPWLRACVLGAMDGLGSTAALIIGLQGGGASQKNTFLGGTAGAVAGAMSMGVSEYVSVSSQRDAEQADIIAEAQEQEKGDAARARELQELTDINKARGLSHDLASKVASELSANDVVAAHARDEHGIDMEALSRPGTAGLSGSTSFALGAAVPIVATAFVPKASHRIIACILSTAAGFMAAGIIAAKLSGAAPWKVSIRLLIGGALELGVTYGVGVLIGASSR